MIEKKCKTCERKFNAIKQAQLFCSRKCFKRDYYKRNKERIRLLANKKPIYKCPNCTHETTMPFDPTKHYSKFNSFKCPACKMKREEAIHLSD